MRLLMIGVAIILGIVFLPGLLSGGTDGAKSSGKGATDQIVDAAKDPHAVGEAVGKVTDPVMEVATPWWETLIAQPWFYAAVIAGAVAWFARRWWLGMGHGAQKITLVAVVIVVMLVAIGVNQ